MADRAVPESVTGPSLRMAPPSPYQHGTGDDEVTHLTEVNASFNQNFQTVAGDNLQRRMDIPPSTAFGMVEIKAVNLPRKLRAIAMKAALRITETEAIRVIPITPVFSP